MQIRKICIKSIAVLMAVIVMVSTPLSRFADTKGVSDTHAVAPALITLGGLFGAIAGAYGLYVAADKLGDMAEGWFNWTADNAVDARTDLQKIKDGVTSYVVSKVVTESVADYLSTVESADITVQINNKVVQPYNYLPDTSMTDMFLEYFNSEFQYREDAFFVTYRAPSSGYPSGSYVVWCIDDISDCLVSAQKIPSYHSSLIVDSPSGSSRVLNYLAFDSEGNQIYIKTQIGRTSGWSQGLLYYNDGWKWRESNVISGSNFKNYVGIEDTYASMPVLVSSKTSLSGLSLSDLESEKIDKTFALDYSTHGNNALDNTNALEGAELTETQLQAIQQAVEKEYSNVVQFPSSGGDNEEDNNPSNLDNAMFTALIANAVAQAVANTLKDMGYIKNPTDEPSGENVKEQLGNIQISLDGLIDAISQINPAQGLANIAQGIAELPQKITASVTDAIRSVFEDLFVPDEGAIQDKVDEITDKFAFADSLLTVVDDIDGALKNASGPPEIYIHFEDAEDLKYTPIGTLKLLSFEWYERYKPYGDALLSSMLWLFFLWKVRKRIAEIVQGLSASGESDVNASANSAIGIERGHRP